MQAASRSILLGAILAASGFAAAQNAEKAPPPAKSVADSINEIWMYMERSFIALADAMPEGKWDFKPTQGEFKGVRTFAEQVKHVACANEAWAKKLGGEKPPARCDLGGPNPSKSKSEIMAYLKDSFHMMDAGIAATNANNMLEPVHGPYGGDNRLAVLEYALWHATDHSGQLVEYLRMNGTVPPASR